MSYCQQLSKSQNTQEDYQQRTSYFSTNDINQIPQNDQTPNTIFQEYFINQCVNNCQGEDHDLDLLLFKNTQENTEQSQYNEGRFGDDEEEINNNDDQLQINQQNNHYSYQNQIHQQSQNPNLWLTNYTSLNQNNNLYQNFNDQGDLQINPYLADYYSLNEPINNNILENHTYDQSNLFFDNNFNTLSQGEQQINTEYNHLQGNYFENYHETNELNDNNQQEDQMEDQNNLGFYRDDIRVQVVEDNVPRENNQDEILIRIRSTIDQIPHMNLIQLRSFRNCVVKKNLIKYILQQVNKNFNLLNAQEYNDKRIHHSNYQQISEIYDKLNMNQNDLEKVDVILAFSFIYNENEIQYNYTTVRFLFKGDNDIMVHKMKRKMIEYDENIYQTRCDDYFIRLYYVCQQIYKEWFLEFVEKRLISYLYNDYKKDTYPNQKYPLYNYRLLDIHMAEYLINDLFIKNIE